jgi:hypothetical protein
MVFAVICLTCFALPAADIDDLVLNIRPVQFEYCLGDAVLIDAEVTNRGKKPTVVDTRALTRSGQLRELQAKPTTTETPWIHTWNRFGVVADDTSRLVLLAPGKTYRTQFDVLSAVRNPVGAAPYLLRLSYSNYDEGDIEGTSAALGEIESDTVYFVIRECSGPLHEDEE